LKLVRRLTVALLAAIGVVFALDAAMSVRSHLELFERDLRRDERLLGGALEPAVTEAWRDHGQAYAIELVRKIDQRRDGLRVRLVLLDAQPGEPLAPAVPNLALAAVRGERTVYQVRADEEGGERLYTYLPLDVLGDSPAALEMSESLTDEREYLGHRVVRSLMTAGIMFAVCGALAWALGIRMVGQPIARLVEKSRRIGSGDFSQPLELHGSDELSQLAEEMNGMAASLDAAARKVASESTARIAALEQLRHADRLTTVGKLAAGIAHELGTPLNVVAGRAGMIASGEIAERDELVRTARVIQEQTARVTRIVRQLLDFARRRSTEKRVAELAPIARQAAALLEPLASRRGVKLECVAPGEPVRAVVDAGQIQQALLNLIVNAVHASSRGGAVRVELAAHTGPPPGAPPYLVGACAELRVTDEGTGIPADQLPAIFDPFFTTKAVGEGTGLGLSVAHGIVDEHHGWIEVWSEVGRGSRFAIWLPREATA
jgi:signal transduction histidine kinase